MPSQWEAGAKEGQIINPETYTLDNSLLTLPRRMEALMDLFWDHRTNVALYPKFQQFIRDSKVSSPFLIDISITSLFIMVMHRYL